MMTLFALAHNLAFLIPGDIAFFFIAISAVGATLAWRNSAGEPPAIEDRPAPFHWTGLAIGLMVVIFALADWALLAALPRLGLSFGPVRSSLTWISVARLMIWIGVWIGVAGLKLLPRYRRKASDAWSGPWLVLLVFLAISIAMVDAMYIEPFDLRTTYVKLPAAKSITRPLRIVHLSDIHVERITRRERELIERVNILQPDIIVLTGDYLNIDYVHDPQTRKDGRWVLSHLQAPYGVYAIAGSEGVDVPETMTELFNGSHIRLLEDEIAAVDAGGARLDILGVSTVHGRENGAVVAAEMSRSAEDSYSLLLYHSPDMAEAAAQAGVDLYLAGHTHGGQVRLPIYGAIITMSAYGKRFEAGQYQLDDTTLYVSRGIGMEGLRLPRVRFLCPPEIVVIDLVPPVSAIGDGGELPGSAIPATEARP